VACLLISFLRRACRNNYADGLDICFRTRHESLVAYLGANNSALPRRRMRRFGCMLQ
jgi:hypothetical protein